MKPGTDSRGSRAVPTNLPSPAQPSPVQSSPVQSSPVHIQERNTNMPTSASAAILVTGMLVTGCSNSLWSKFQDQQCVENCDDPDPSRRRNFEQPVWQTLNMFVGEACCIVAFFMIQRMSGGRGGAGSAASKERGVYTAVPRDSLEGGLLQEEEAQESTLGDVQQPTPQAAITLSDSLVLPAHLTPRTTTTTSSSIGPPPTPLAVHGPAPAPLATALEPHLLVTQYEPSILHLAGLQKLVFWLPALFDICGTTLMNAGLLFVPVSVFQMMRGALPLWVGLFSILFLNRHLTREKWLSLGIITAGVALVGYAGSLQQQPVQAPAQEIEASTSLVSAQPGAKVVLGLFLIFFAQLFTASQFVIEEKIMSKYEVPPLEAVGLEGVFGLMTTLAAIPVLHMFIGSREGGRGGYFDARTGVEEVLGNARIMWSSLAIAVSIALFNFCGLAVTKTVSATARAVIDTCRAVGIWAVSLALGWEHFSALQLLGFLVLVLGTFLFNDILHYPHAFTRRIRANPPPPEQRLD
ncbi:hypothetical protein PCASD_08849 [Puccinia coronata f. sp. avenae]|uniref:EamA domain-containing protein n=1 Tax=Puccinia coronata f. sp. avenae TaxID=200324 RepID=A0A2N5URY8_9BASI|nr:hypothetical protein PCASD_08849 [Puccinia coronata f. sp. avenae]